MRDTTGSIRTSPYLDDTAERMTGMRLHGAPTFGFVRRNVGGETAGDGPTFMVDLEHDPDGRFKDHARV